MATQSHLLLFMLLLSGSLIIVGCSQTITQSDPQSLKIYFCNGFGNGLDTF